MHFATKPIIENPNSSGQGYSPESNAVPSAAQDSLDALGYRYSHSVPVWHERGAALGRPWSLHHVWRKGDHAVSFTRTIHYLSGGALSWSCTAHWIGSGRKRKVIAHPWVPIDSARAMRAYLRNVAGHARRTGRAGFKKEGSAAR